MQALDATNSPADNANGPVTIQMLSAPAGATFTSSSATMTAGTATLANLKVSAAGTYKFRITANGLVLDITFSTTGRRL